MFRRRDRDRELHDEIRAHLAMATRDRIERGEDPAHAVAAARREFGNPARVHEITREMWGWTSMERLAQDLRYAFRILRRAPGFTAVAIVSLSLGIGATAAIFQVVEAVGLRSLPIARPHELVEIAPVTMDGARGSFSTWRQSVSNPIWEQIREHQQTFSGVLAYGGRSFNLATAGEVRRARGLLVSGGFFDALEVRPLAGRLLSPVDDQRGCEPRAILSHAFWQREFGGSLAAVGSRITLDGRPVEIVGVTPPSFFGLEVGRAFDVAVPLCAEPAITGGPGRLESGTDWWLIVMGRLRPGVTIDQASAHLRALSPGIFEATLKPNYPAVSVPKYLAMQLHALPAATGVSYLREVYAAPLWLLLALAVLVLLIACANLANLLLARASAREHEIAVRLGLGAARRRIVRQLLTESAVLATAGAAAGLLLARVLADALVAFVDADQQNIVLDLATDWRLIGFTAALAALTCLVFGLVPAVRATRLAPGAVLQHVGRGLTMTRHTVTLRRALIVGQVAVSVVMLFGALLFTRTARNLAAVDLGFERRGVVIAGVDYRRATVAPEQGIAHRLAILERLRAIPGVQAAATTAMVPVSGDAWGNSIELRASTGPQTVDVRFNRVSQGFFETFRVPLRAGRDFDSSLDTSSSPQVAIVNETLASMFEGGRAIGGRFAKEATPTSPQTEYEIVGIVADSKYESLREDPLPVAYLAMTQEEEPDPRVMVAVRGEIDAAALTGSIVGAMREIDPTAGVSFTRLDSFIDATLARERLLATLSSFFGALAAALAAIGVYGVIAYSVARRTSEIGIRVALGATRWNVAAMVLREAGVPVAVGLTIGVTLALASGRFAESLLFGLEPRDPLSVLMAVLMLGSVALIASLGPARAASRIEPTIALRCT